MEDGGNTMKKIIVRAPVLSRSGYGEHGRFVLRSLRSREDLFDIYLININWGQTGWTWEDNEERRWIDATLDKTYAYINSGGQFDISVQVTIPNEWEKMAPVNIGVTAGIETTKVAPQWIEKSILVDKIITVSEHSKQVYENSSYQAQNKETGEVIQDFRCTTPIEVVHYPVRDFEPAKLDLNLDHNFNFLTVAQISPRKNMHNTIKWFVEEFKNDEVGLVVKCNIKCDSTQDRLETEKAITQLLNENKDRKCKVYLLHGSMTENEITALYQHSKIKSLVSLTHGEGFGLPIFEAAYNELPVVAPDWSGHVDFLYVPIKNKKTGKTKNKAHFAKVEYTLQPIQEEAHWDGVLQKDSLWCYANEISYKKRLREVYKDYNRFKSQAKKLNKWIRKNFTKEVLYKKFVNSIFLNNKPAVAEQKDFIFVSDFFSHQVLGGAELSLQALIDDSPGTKSTINCAQLSNTFIDSNKESTWIFGNISQMSDEILQYVIDSKVKYHFIEFDYKFCEYRNPFLYQMLEEKECDYAETDKGKIIANFVNRSVMTHFMSQKQMEIYKNSLNGLDESKLFVLGSIFDGEFFDQIKNLRNQLPADRKKYLVLGSRSWVKGFADSEKWCTENNIEYDVISDITHLEVLEKLATAKGICFKPSGLDTCPRYVIEAKLLGCELELNENVQHLDEEWFNTDDVDSIIDYLKSRRGVFWNRVSKQ
mgnify:FL=1